MGATSTFTTDAVPPDEAVVATSFCSEITVYEDAGNATVGFTVREPAPTSPAITIPPGGSHTFRRPGEPYSKGEKVGYVAALSGTLNLAQVER